MAGSKSNYLSIKLLDHVLGDTAYTAPATVYIGLWTSGLEDEATGSTSGQPSGGSYARAAVTNNTTNWPNATGTTTALKQNGTSIAFPTATGAWGTITQFALLDAATLGDILFWGTLTTSKIIGNGDTASFSAFALSITED